jgi:hypothetical protein
MASLEERRGIYYATFFDSTRTPKRKRISLGTKRKETAQRLFFKLEGEVARGERDPWEKEKPTEREPAAFAEALNEMLTAKEAEVLSHGSPLPVMPLTWTCVLVRIAARLGPQIELPTNAFVKRAPSCAATFGAVQRRTVASRSRVCMGRTAGGITGGA